MKRNNLLISIASCLLISQAQAIEPVYDGEDGIRAKVFETNCLGCHSSELAGAARNGAPEDNYDTYIDALAHGDDAIKHGVELMDMPPASSQYAALTEEQKQALQNWEVLGFPEKNLPAIFSSSSQKLELPSVYLKDENGDISLKWDAEMEIVPNSNPLQFELTDVKEIDTSTPTQ